MGKQFHTMPQWSENLLKLGGGRAAPSDCQVRFSAYIHMVEAGNVDETNLLQLDG